MIYYILLLLLMMHTVTKAQQQWQFHITSNTTYDYQLNLKEISNELNIFTRQLPHLNILLRTKSLENDAANPYVRWFLKQSHVPLIVSSYNVTNYEYKTNLIDSVKAVLFRKSRDSFVITTESQQLDNVAKRFVQKAGVFFFVITDTKRPKDYDKFLNILNSLWIKYKIYKNFILTFEGIFHFDPFVHNSAALQKYGGLVPTRNISEPFERKLFRNMHGYPLRVQIFKSVFARPPTNESNLKISDFYGVDGRVAELLEQKMNFTMILQKPDPNYFGERTQSGKYNGAIGSILDDKIDFCFTGFFVKDYLVSEYMDFTVAVYDDKLCLYVAKAKRIPKSILPLFSVNYDVWLSFILSGFVCCFIWWLLRRLNIWLKIRKFANTSFDGRSQWSQFYRICIDTWVVWVSVTILRQPPFNSERVFMGSLCLASVIFGAIFESSLATVFIHPLHYKDINTLKELDESNLKIIYKFSSMADDLFVSDTSSIYARLDKKLVHVKDLDADIMDHIAKNGGKASVTRASSLFFESLHFILAQEIYVIQECPKYYTISYVHPKDSPWQETVNNWLLQFLSSGLMVKWMNDMKTDVDIDIRTSGMLSEKDVKFKILTVSDLQLAFYVVVMGNTLAVLSLIAEFGIKSYNNHYLKAQNKNV